MVDILINLYYNSLVNKTIGNIMTAGSGKILGDDIRSQSEVSVTLTLNSAQVKYIAIAIKEFMENHPESVSTDNLTKIITRVSNEIL